MDTVVKNLWKCFDYFLRLSGFPDLSGEVFLVNFKLSQLDYSLCFAIAMQIKQFNFF